MRRARVPHGHGPGGVDALRLQDTGGVEQGRLAAGDKSLPVPVPIEDAGAGGADLEADQAVVMFLQGVQVGSPSSAVGIVARGGT